MVFPIDPHDRLPRGDKNRRLSLGISRDEFAAAAGISADELHDYEHTQPDRHFSFAIAQRVGETLEQLEATRVPLVYNGPVPHIPAPQWGGGAEGCAFPAFCT